MIRPPPKPTLFPSTPLFRSRKPRQASQAKLLRSPADNCQRETQVLNDWLMGLLAGVATIPASSPISQSFRTCVRSEEHTSELQSPCNLVCRLLLAQKKKYTE